MKHRPRPEEQDGLLRTRLVYMFNPQHKLVQLAVLIDREEFKLKWSGFFPSGRGRASRRRSWWWGFCICSTPIGWRTRQKQPVSSTTTITTISLARPSFSTTCRSTRHLRRAGGGGSRRKLSTRTIQAVHCQNNLRKLPQTIKGLKRQP
jgi:hypothetical protein